MTRILDPAVRVHVEEQGRKGIGLLNVQERDQGGEVIAAEVCSNIGAAVFIQGGGQLQRRLQLRGDLGAAPGGDGGHPRDPRVRPAVADGQRLSGVQASEPRGGQRMREIANNNRYT